MVTITLPHYGTETVYTSSYGPYVLVPNSSGGTSRVCPELVRAVVIAYWRAGLLDKLVWTQGGLNNGAVGASAKVHDGLCVCDLRTTNLTDAEEWRLARSLLECGVLCNLRGVGGGDSLTEHAHCVMLNPRHGHPQAVSQVREYLEGGDGLVGERPFYGPKVPFVTWENSPYYGLDDFDMAEPKDVWTAKLAGKAAGDILLSIATMVQGLPAKAASTLLATKLGSRELNGWTVGHLIDWNSRTSLAQGKVLGQIVTLLEQISKGQAVTQADLAKVRETLKDLAPEDDPEPEPEVPEVPEEVAR